MATIARRTRLYSGGNLLFIPSLYTSAALMQESLKRRSSQVLIVREPIRCVNVFDYKLILTELLYCTYIKLQPENKTR